VQDATAVGMEKMLIGAQQALYIINRGAWVTDALRMALHTHSVSHTLLCQFD
jgi:hypothetical protein